MDISIEIYSIIQGGLYVFERGDGMCIKEEDHKLAVIANIEIFL